MLTYKNVYTVTSTVWVFKYYVIYKPIYRERLWDQQNNDMIGVGEQSVDSERGRAAWGAEIAVGPIWGLQNGVRGQVQIQR